MCPQTDYLCSDRITCIDKQWLCDGGKDCPDGDDENFTNCRNRTCRDDQFQCKDLTCIPGHLMCSGVPECPDGSDEINCSKYFVYVVKAKKNSASGFRIYWNFLNTFRIYLWHEIGLVDRIFCVILFWKFCSGPSEEMWQKNGIRLWRWHVHTEYQSVRHKGWLSGRPGWTEKWMLDWWM